MRRPFNGEFLITVRFGDPVSWYKSGKHPGIDWALPNGTPLVACFDGIVSFCDKWNATGYGRHFRVRSNDSVFEALYAHCSSFLVEPNMKIKEGEILGQSGHSGFCKSAHGGDGAHLHFGLMKHNVWVNPLDYLISTNQLKLPVKNADPAPVVEDQNYITKGYVVKRGDSLSSLAIDFYNDATKWKKIFYANTDKIRDPNKIFVGQVLKIPGFK